MIIAHESMKRDYYESVFEEVRTQKLSTLSFIYQCHAKCHEWRIVTMNTKEGGLKGVSF